MTKASRWAMSAIFAQSGAACDEGTRQQDNRSFVRMPLLQNNFNREVAERRMTPQQVKEATAMALYCQQNNFKGCD
jgi:hypothetical protein